MNEELNRLTRKLKTELTKFLGEDDANALLTTISSAGELASLGPLVGLSRLSEGELSREEYLRRYGHRGPHENELAEPRQYEDPDWLDRQLAEFRRVTGRCGGAVGQARCRVDRGVGRDQAQPVAKESPGDRAHDRRRSAETNTLREATRSELTRLVGVIRALFLRAGELAGLGDGVFFLTVDEVVDVLSGDRSSVAQHRRPAGGIREVQGVAAPAGVDPGQLRSLPVGRRPESPDGRL